MVRFVNRLLNPPPAFSGHDIARGGPGGKGVGIHGLMFVLPLVGWGNAVYGALSDYPFWLRASAFYPAARCNAVFDFAQDAHPPCIPLFPDVHRSLWGDIVSHADRARWNPEVDGAMEHSAIGGHIHRSNWLKPKQGNLLPR